MKIDLIVTRHQGLLALLQEKGLATDETVVVAHATAAEVTGKRVCGVLPHSLSCLCESFTEIPLSLPAELRGRELTAEEVRQYAGEPVTYIVRALPPQTETLTWNDRQGNRGRTAFLVLSDGAGKLYNFVGRPIEGVCKSRVLENTRDGKWSNSTFELRLLGGARVAWQGMEDFDTFRVGEGESTWAEMSAAWGVMEKELRAFLPSIAKETADFLSAVE